MAIVVNGSLLSRAMPGAGKRNPPLDSGKRLARSHRRLARPALYNTGISTYVWIVTNRKEPRRKARSN